MTVDSQRDPRVAVPQLPLYDSRSCAVCQQGTGCGRLANGLNLRLLPFASPSPADDGDDSAQFFQRNDILYNNNASATAHESLTFPPGELVVHGVKSRGDHLAQDFLSDVDFEMTVNSAASLLRQANQRAGQMMPKWHGADLANAVG